MDLGEGFCIIAGDVVRTWGNLVAEYWVWFEELIVLMFGVMF